MIFLHRINCFAHIWRIWFWQIAFADIGLELWLYFWSSGKIYLKNYWKSIYRHFSNYWAIQWTKGSHQRTKSFSFVHCPNYISLLPLSPIWTTWLSFFRCKKRCFDRMTELSSDDDNYVWNDIYDCDMCNFVDNDNKNDNKKTCKYYNFL